MKVTHETNARLDQAKMVSRAAVVVSAAVVQGAATVARSLGAAVSSAFMSTSYGQSFASAGTSEAGKAARQVAASGLVAFGEVWDGLEKAAKVFGSAAAEATHTFVEERYGAEAAVAADKSLAVAADVGVAALNMRNVSVGGLVRRTGVEAAKELIGPAHGGAGGAALALPAPPPRPALMDAGAAAGGAGGGVTATAAAPTVSLVDALAAMSVVSAAAAAAAPAPAAATPRAAAPAAAAAPAPARAPSPGGSTFGVQLKTVGRDVTK